MGEEGKTDADYAAENAERNRRDRHHDVLCLALKRAFDMNMVGTHGELVHWSRAIADLAYPPPKAEGAPVTCPACGVTSGSGNA